MASVLLHMKIERWNKDTKQFELVDCKDEDFEELLIGFATIECECIIEDRIESMVTEKKVVLEENVFFYKYD